MTVHKIQKLCGFLNFLCRVIVPGRAFTRRLYALTAGNNLKPHHHIRLKPETKLDLIVWQSFLVHPRVFCRPFLDCQPLEASDIKMFSDASRNFSKGFGAFCGNSWTFRTWNREFMEKAEPSIEYLELFGVTIVVLNWIHRFRNKRIFLFCDNESVVHMINKSTSSCRNCMVLIRIITLQGLIHNVRIYAKFVSMKRNGIADSLSRLQFKRFRILAPHMEEFPEDIPQEVWPLQKIWIN